MLAADTVPVLWVGCLALVLTGAAVQVAVGAGLSVISGPFLFLWLGPGVGVPILLCLNFVVSVVATVCGGRGVRWDDFALASGATLVGCGIAWVLPPLPDAILKAMTAAVLVVVALPRPPVPGSPISTTSIKTGIGLAGLVTGALTVWTATPGPITPVALARAGRSGADIRRTMQPISVVGFGAALVWAGMAMFEAPGFQAPGSSGFGFERFGDGAFASLLLAVLVGTGLGFRLRRTIDPARVVLLVRVIAGAAAMLLIGSLLR